MVIIGTLSSPFGLVCTFIHALLFLPKIVQLSGLVDMLGHVIVVEKVKLLLESNTTHTL